MTGIGGGSGFNYKDFFQQREAGELKSSLDAGELDSQQLLFAACEIINEVASQFSTTKSTESKDKYLDLAQKFSQIFPECDEEIKKIDEFAKNYLGGVKQPQQPTKQEISDEELWKEVDAVLQENSVDSHPMDTPRSTGTIQTQDVFSEQLFTALEKYAQSSPLEVSPQIEFNSLPIMKGEEMIDRLKDTPLGTMMERREPGDDGSVHIALKRTDEGPPYFGVVEYVLIKLAGREEYTDDQGNKLTLKGWKESIRDYFEKEKEAKAKFESLPNIPVAEMVQQLKQTPIGTVAAYRSPDHLGYLLLGVKLAEDPNFGVFNSMFLPSDAVIGKYYDVNAGKDKVYAIDELLTLYQNTYTPPPKTIEECKNAISKAKLPADINLLIERGADKSMLMKAASEMIKQYVLDTSLSSWDLQKKLTDLIKLMGYEDRIADVMSYNVINFRDQYYALLTNTKLPNARALTSMMTDLLRSKDTSIVSSLLEPVTRGLEGHYHAILENIGKQLRNYSTEGPDDSEEAIIEDYNMLRTVAQKINIPIPESYKKEFAEKVMVPVYQRVGTPQLQKALAGKLSELSIEDLSKISNEISRFGELPVPEQIHRSAIIEAVYNYVNTNQVELKDHPEKATRAHHLLHEFAQEEIEKGNFATAFAIEGKAAAIIPLSATHPLHDMDKAILAGTAKQLNPQSGAHFSSLDTSIVKGGNLHAAQRTIDGKLLNCFDFKVSHYARDELTKHLEMMLLHTDEFKADLPHGLCSDLQIKTSQNQQYIHFDEAKGEYTRASSYSPNNSKATEVVFEGAGKIIIGETKLNGCMYNWIQVEMDANLPPGEGAKKLQQMLAVSGLGPVIGQQPPDADERMKIAQLFRAFYPSKATSLDTTKEFYRIPIENLVQEIIDREPRMADVFKKYLETSPELMTKIEIMPGKEIWAIKDLGQLMRANGAWGVMTGVGNSGGWKSAKNAVERILTQGALSSEQRFQTGIFKAGTSSEMDIFTGGGDQVFTRLINDNVAQQVIQESDFPLCGNAQILWNLEKAAQRVPYGYGDDKYGEKNRFDTMVGDVTYEDYQTRDSVLDLAGTVSSGKNEMMFKNALDPSHVQGVVVRDQKRKDDLINHLINKGLAEKDATGVYIKFAGKRIKADDFIHAGFQFMKEWWD